MKAELTLDEVDSLKEGDVLIDPKGVRTNMHVLETDIIGEMVVEAHHSQPHEKEYTAGVKVRERKTTRERSYKQLINLEMEVHRPAKNLTDDQIEMVRERHATA